MNKNLRYLLILSLLISVSAKAQFQGFRDSVVQLYGVVMTADSLKGLPSVSVVVKGTGRGTISNDQGVFSIVVLKGDQIEFTSVGFKPKLVNIPQNLEGNQFSVIQLMVTDTIYLPATIIKSRPSRQQFERDFLNTAVPDDKLAIAQKNTDDNTRRFLVATLPSDGREAASNYLRTTAAKTYYAGQTPPMNIFNPFAWSEFIKAWKRGDFKKKTY
ncbi:MAG: carboxypeptidase-like regulatory domain-containing protein [Ferruginibacter sp.]